MFEQLPTPPEPARRYWCLHCGAPALYLMPSMDPAHPIGLCQGSHRSTARHLVSADRDEVDALLTSMAETRAAIRAERRKVGGKQSAII